MEKRIFNMLLYIISIVAILEIVALIMKIDGTTFASVMAFMTAIAGYLFRLLLDKLKKEKD